MSAMIGCKTSGMKPNGCVLSVALLFAALPGARAADAPTHVASLVYDGALVSNTRGGVKRDSTYLGNLHVRDLLDLERAWGWKDSHLYADAVWIAGGSPDRAVGDATGVSNLAAPPGLQPNELWLETDFRSNSLSALVGLYDLNTEFYRLQSSGLFMNSAFGVGPELAASGVEGPSTFPRTSLGLRLAYKPTENLVLRGAVFDGVPLIRDVRRYAAFESGDGLLYLGEIAVLDRPESVKPAARRMRIGRTAGLPPYQGKFAVGAWYYTAELPRIDPTESAASKRGSSGFYAIADRIVARRAGDDSRTLSAFAEAGLADDEVNRFGRSLAVGLVAVGPFASRKEDELGLALSTVRNGAPYVRANGSPFTERSETVGELSYLLQGTSWLAMQADLQYVMNPGTVRGIPNALVFSLHFEVSLESGGK